MFNVLYLRCNDLELRLIYAAQCAFAHVSVFCLVFPCFHCVCSSGFCACLQALIDSFDIKVIDMHICIMSSAPSLEL
jgi:hypothetical protein